MPEVKEEKSAKGGVSPALPVFEAEESRLSLLVQARHSSCLRQFSATKALSASLVKKGTLSLRKMQEKNPLLCH